MTPAQVAHIMSLVDRYIRIPTAERRALIEAALRDAPQQAETVALGIMKLDTTLPFYSDEELAAQVLAARPSAPTAVEPTGEEVSVVEPRDERAHFHAWASQEGYDMACNYDNERSRWIYFNPMTADLWKAWRASKGTK